MKVTEPLKPAGDFADPRLFINRELSWLSFNGHVLDEALDASLPLYERLKFFGIVASNLDEFFMVRVAGLKKQLSGNVADTGPDGMPPAEQLAGISERVHALVERHGRLWREELIKLLGAQGVQILPASALTAEQRTAAHHHYASIVFPALTPLAVDPGHPFPQLRNKSLNVAVLLRKEGRRRKREQHADSSFAVVQVPAVLGRLVRLPPAGSLSFILMEDLIAAHAGELFPGYVVKHSATFRVTRNWDLNVDEEESEDLLSTIEDELRRRDRGAAVRLELDAGASPELEEALTGALKLGTPDVYRSAAPLQPADLNALVDLDPRSELRVEPHPPTLPPQLRDLESFFPLLSQRDVLLHHPYESFDAVVRFVEEAADDPNVLAIKQTLYRTSGDSPIARALARAAENGKQVAVLVEIKARLDEANNIAWARRLEENGVHVVYGLIGLKTHCKVLLVVRREGTGIRRYVHLGTGNYNPTTARQYTDLSLFTARPEIAEDVTALFNMLTGYSEPPRWKRLAVAPLGLQARTVELIERETRHAQKGEPARIVAKMNSLVDPTVIRALYAASAAGVQIDLLVRGICCLRPGVPAVSENIRVTAVVDRFLEHSRIFSFGVGERAEVYASSADWMPRNFHRRIEVMFPIEDAQLRARLLEEVMGLGLRDTVKARRLQVDGSYVRVPPSGAPVRSQLVLLETAKRQGELKPLETMIRHVAAPEAVAPARPPAAPAA